MPIYEYACPQCHTTFEEWLKSDDSAALHPCPECGAQAPRLISNTTFILKGGGWYVTEYGSHKDGQEQAASASSGPEGTAGAPGSSEASGGSDAGTAKEGAAAPSGDSGGGSAPAEASKAEVSASPAPPAKPASPSPAPSAGA